MTPETAANALRQGQVLNVDVDTGVAAIALTIPYLFNHINPTQTNGASALAKFRKLCDNAGLPHDHQVFASWFAFRALRAQAGDAILVEYDCPVAVALAAALGTVAVANEAHILRDDQSNPAAISLTRAEPTADESGVIATPAGTLRFPGCPIASSIGTWASALAAIDKVAASFGRKAYDADPDAIVELDFVRPGRDGKVDADSIHEDWAPEIAFHADLKPHPSRLIQSATLATVSPPPVAYRPRLPRRVISSGFISNAQFDFIAAAGEAHQRFLPIDPDADQPQEYRTGFDLADGTGAGKTNEILGVILDNFLRGRTQAVIVLAKRRHRHGFLETWARMGRDRRDFQFQWALKPGQDFRGRQGIILTTYSTLRDFNATAEEYPRIEQLERWLGEDFEGVMAFDESQEMRNAAGFEDVSGRSNTSRQGLSGIAVQDRFPKARVVYASATGATDVHNLAYATRLGLWGAGTCFPQRSNFISTFEQGGIADLEQVTLSLKAAGVYMARSLSFDGVETRHLAVTLTQQERDVYNEASRAWGRLFDAMGHCAELCGVPSRDEKKMRELAEKGASGAVPYSNLNGMFESNRKSSMATLIAAFKARAVIVDAKENIDSGHAVVIQMQNTYEAQLNRALDRLEDITNIRLEPAELISFAEALPTEEYHLVKSFTEKGNEILVWEPKLDAVGKPVINGHAAACRQRMIDEVRSIKLPLPPLDQIMLAFGPGRLAEVTGRTKRLIPNKPNGDLDGANGVLIEDRTEAHRLKDIEAFHDGRKQGLVFSTGAGGASLSYHAKIGTKNTARRVHYVIQLGYRADEVTQGFGRTHRSDQVHPPILTIVSCDLPADRLYASRIVSALFKLGALTQGHRHAASNGMFDERDCLDGPYAIAAWEDLQLDVQEGLIPDYTWEQFMMDLGLDFSDSDEMEEIGNRKARSVLTNVNRMINRVAALTDRRQDLIFEHLRTRIDKRIEKAIADGTFNAGPEILKASSLQIVSEKLIEQDEVHGARTRVLRIRKKSELATNTWKEAQRRYFISRAGAGGYANFVKHRTTGQVALHVPGKPFVDIMGRRLATKDIITPTSTQNRLARIVEREPWMPMGDMELLQAMWDAAVEAAPREAISYVTIVTDALLPIWSALKQGSGFRNAVYRLQTDEGQQIVGRPLAPESLEGFFSMIGVSAAPCDEEVAEIAGHLRTGARVALVSKATAPHYLSGVFTGSEMTGVEIEIGASPSPTLNVALEALVSGHPGRGAGAVLRIASQRSAIDHALRTVMAVAPAKFVEEDITAKVAPLVPFPLAANSAATSVQQQQLAA
ncbi:strawberry notch-like NTP hydrolase domain-containing protein [Sphingosinicella sp. BN140058]|uniref:strawberry notch-like NTP hydrolase domain-containing protein n=1 Tax=Sphingosinicella sp. BN140058 TaxID=1892855 RepID=UPI0010121886|nr:strawberry notch family protein [Sphingosinicella sp. BN140058]QAY80169.1 hypothetical protein ETR14_26360 [Sphingosinicella sp. BN140058]